MASEGSNKLQLCDLPFELLCLVLELVEVRELFPCFLVSSWFRQAADHDLCWKSRYQRDFSVASLEDPAAAASPSPSSSWKEAYRFNAELCWDTTECTALPLEHHSGGNAKVTLENAFSESNRVVRWEGRYGYLSVRTKQCFKKEGASGGVFACEFLARHFNDAHSYCLGVADNLFAHGDIIEIKGCHNEKYSNRLAKRLLSEEQRSKMEDIIQGHRKLYAAQGWQK
ncbi:hypothetical protein QOT17_018242 [Balamuthia mandrillaris]